MQHVLEAALVGAVTFLAYFGIMVGLTVVAMVIYLPYAIWEGICLLIYGKD